MRGKLKCVGTYQGSPVYVLPKTVVGICPQHVQMTHAGVEGGGAAIVTFLGTCWRTYLVDEPAEFVARQLGLPKHAPRGVK